MRFVIFLPVLLKDADDAGAERFAKESREKAITAMEVESLYHGMDLAEVEKEISILPAVIVKC